MKFKSLISIFFLIALAFSASAQRRINPEKQISKAPGNDPVCVTYELRKLNC